jgi:hypothetical protein
MVRFATFCFFKNCHQSLVPVYDAQDVDFNLQESITAVKDVLPTFSGEIPRNSFVIVGYTAGTYHSRKDNGWHISANLQWAIVVGVPA